MSILLECVGRNDPGVKNQDFYLEYDSGNCHYKNPLALALANVFFLFFFFFSTRKTKNERKKREKTKYKVVAQWI